MVEQFNFSRELSVFERHVLSVVARNVFMLLTVHTGKPVFGRSSVFSAAQRAHLQLPMSALTWQVLGAGHLAFMRNVTFESPGDTLRPEQLLNEVRDLIDFARAIFS